MVEKIVGFFSREIKGLHEAAYLLAAFTFFSQLLAVVRDRLLASNFGASSTVDIYYAAFRIPDFIFVLVTSFISASVLIPYLSRFLSDKISMKKMIDSLFSVFLLTIITISVIIFIFTPEILKVTMPGIMNSITPDGLKESTQLILFTRILLLSPILLGISQLFGSIVQAYRTFFIYAMSPVLYNIGIIIGIVLFYPVWGPVGLIYGVVLGIISHVLIQLPTVKKYELLPKITLNIEWNLIKEMVLISLPRAITLASTQLILLTLVAIASTLSVGAISVFNFSYNLQSVPLAIIGVSYSMAAFPTLSRLFANGNRDEFLSHVITAARHIIFWSFPVIIMFIVLRAQIVRTILGAGLFDWSATRLTAAALAIFAISVLAQSLILLFVRGYYSAGQTKKPLIANIVSMFVTILLAFVFISIFREFEIFRNFFESLFRVPEISSTIVLMLPLAFSIGMILNVVILWIMFEKDFNGFSKTLGTTFTQSMFASLVAGYIAYFGLNMLDDVFNLNTVLGIFSQGFFAGILGIIGFFGVLLLFQNNESKEIVLAFKNKVWRTKDVVVDQEELSI